MMDETDPLPTAETAGERLRAAREAQGLSLDAIAAQTRIPTRHLAALERSEWDGLPAPTYTVGFGKSYAAVVGLDRDEIADQLRTEIGGARQVHAQPEVFQPADPKRSMPKWLILVAFVALLGVLLLLNWRRERELTPDAAPPTETTQQASNAAGPAPPQTPQAAPTGQVTLAATQPVWLEVREKGGAILKQGQLNPGERFDVPATATAPILKTGRPEALRITVAGRDVPAIGRPGRSVAGVSLVPADLARGPGIPVAPASTSPSPVSPRTPARPMAAPPTAASPQPSPTETNNTAE